MHERVHELAERGANYEEHRFHCCGAHRELGAYEARGIGAREHGAARVVAVGESPALESFGAPAALDLAGVECGERAGGAQAE